MDEEKPRRGLGKIRDMRNKSNSNGNSSRRAWTWPIMLFTGDCIINIQVPEATKLKHNSVQKLLRIGTILGEFPSF